MLYPATGSGELVGAFQLRSTSCATPVPVPLRAAIAVPPLVELLLTVICPVRAPAVVGLNCSCSVRVCVGFSVTGKPPPTMVKPAPVIEAEFTVTGVVPVDVKVNVCVVAVFTAMLPKFRLAALIVSCGFPAVPVPLSETIAWPPATVRCCGN